MEMVQSFFVIKVKSIGNKKCGNVYLERYAVLAINLGCDLAVKADLE